MSTYRKDYDDTKYISFLIKDDELLKKYNEIWEKVKNSFKKEFDSESVYNEKLNPINNGKINSNFQNDKIPKEGSQFICLSVILIDSVFRTGNNYYPQVFSEECKYGVKGKKIPKYIFVDIENSSDSDKENTGEESLRHTNITNIHIYIYIYIYCIYKNGK